LRSGGGIRLRSDTRADGITIEPKGSVTRESGGVALSSGPTTLIIFNISFRNNGVSVRVDSQEIEISIPEAPVPEMRPRDVPAEASAAQPQVPPQSDDEGPYIFISYAHADRHLVLPEVAWLKEAGFVVWFDDGIKTGAIWAETLATKIRGCVCQIVYVTPRSLSSKGVLKELRIGEKAERPLLPIELEPSSISPAFEWYLEDTQRIAKYNYPEERFREKLKADLSERFRKPGGPAPSTKA